MAEAITARGVIARTPNAPGEIEEFIVPHPGPGEALVKFLASGVCHTDLSAKNGVFGTDYFPFLLGHEGSGIVEEVGPGFSQCRTGRLRDPGLARAMRQLPILPGRPTASLCRQPERHPEDDHHGRNVLTPILGIGTFCTHTLVHARQCVNVDKDPAAGADESDRLRRHDRSRRRPVLSRMFSRDNPWPWLAVEASATRSSWARNSPAPPPSLQSISIPRNSSGPEVSAPRTRSTRRDGDPVAAIKQITGGFGVNASFEAVGNRRRS